MRRTTIITWLVAAGLAIGLASHAWAQYPPPAGNLTVGAGDTTPDLGASVTVTATLLDETGEPVAGVECSFSIADQPGSDASVAAGPFTTDADGSVTTALNTGSTAGTIAIEATCGELSAQVSVVAGAPGALPPGALPPASLPDTGGAGAEEGINWLFWTLIAAGALIGTSGLFVAWRRVKA